MDTKKLIKQTYHLFNYPFLTANTLLNRYKDKVWLIGDSRSGTSWVSRLINHNKNFRVLFEPFQPNRSKKMDFFKRNSYRRINEEDQKLKITAENLFSGLITHYHIDFNPSEFSLIYDGILIKDVTVNLSAYWIYKHVSGIKPILLLRNPFFVALSKHKKMEWGWKLKAKDLLKDNKLKEDYLHIFEDLILSVDKEKNFILDKILLWSVLNYVPLKQFSKDELYVLLYESVYLNPDEEISKLMPFINSQKWQDSINLQDRLIYKPSRSSKNYLSDTCSKKEKLASFNKKCDQGIIREGWNILKEFDLHHFYNESGMPAEDGLAKWGFDHER